MRATQDTSANRVLRVLLAERAKDLSQRLRLPVLVHDLGWGSTDIEVQIRRRADGSVVPRRVLMGAAAIDVMLLDREGVHGRFERYNAVIAQLRGLARQLADLRPRRRGARRLASTLAYARATLATLDELVAGRERAAMGRGAVRLTTLDLEIAFFVGYHAWLAPIAESVTGSAPISAMDSSLAPAPCRRRRPWRLRPGRHRKLESPS